MTLLRLYQRNGAPVNNENASYRYSDLLKDFFGHDEHNTPVTNPRANIVERSDAFEIEIALPGLTRKDIRMEVDKDVLSISHARNNEEKSVENYHRREFGFHNFYRSFRLPETINMDKISAKMENGILWITLPKKDEAVDKGPREINIS